MKSSKTTYPDGGSKPLFLREQDIEEAFIEKLRNLKYTYRSDIRDRAALEHNFRQKFEALNRVRLTDGEFQRLLDELITPAIEDKNVLRFHVDYYRPGGEKALKTHKQGLMQQLFPVPEEVGE